MRRIARFGDKLLGDGKSNFARPKLKQGGRGSTHTEGELEAKTARFNRRKNKGPSQESRGEGHGL
jgi:hypothetical protein